MHLYCILFSYVCRFLEHADLQCALQSILSSEFPFLPGYGLHPIVDHLIVPWAGIIRQWDDPGNSRRQACVEPNVSSILLSPAPGEQFDITIQVLDQMLNLAGSTAILQVLIYIHDIMLDYLPSHVMD